MIDLLNCSFILNYKHSMVLYNHILVIGSGQPAVSNQFLRGTTSSHLNSLGSIQGCCLIWHIHLVKPLAIITCLSLVLEELEALWWGMNPMVHRWSLMCANHIDMIAHTPAFLLSWVPLVYMWSAAQLGLVMYHTMEQSWQDGHPSMY